MPSSTDIAQLFASQQGQFSQQNYFAQTIGVQQMGMGLGGSSFFAPSSMQRPQGPPPPPGVSPPPPVFSYGPGGMGAFGPSYGAGNAFAGNVMSGLGGAAAAGGVGLGLASMLAPGSMMGRIGGALDPVSAFLRAGPAMPLINAGGTGTLAAGLGAAALPLAVGTGLAMAGRSVMHGAQQQQQIGAQLGQFGFLNPASRTGQGFSRQDATEIGGTVRQLGHLPELLTSVEELTRLLPKMRQTGVMSGVKDAAEFTRRFKETVSTIRDMSKMLGTTMEEASQMFAHNRQVGFSNTAQQLGNTLAVQYTSGATGMSVGQVMGMQASGAATARAFGAKGRYGAQGVTNIAQKLQSNLESGVITEDLLTDITGEVGDAAKQGTAQMMLQASLGLTQSSAGQALMAGLMKKGKDGKFELDQDLMASVGRGEKSLDWVKARGSMLGNDAKMAFKGPQGKNLSAQLAASGILPGFVGGLVSQHGEEGAELLMDKYTGGQLGQPMIEGLLKLGKGGGLGMSLEDFAGTRGKEMDIQSRTDPRQMWERIKRKLHSGTYGKLESVGAEANQAISKMYEDFIDDLVGRKIVTLSKGGAEAFKQAMRGGDKTSLMAMFDDRAVLGQGGSGLGGALSGGSEVSAGILRMFGDGRSSGRNASQQREYLSGVSGLSGKALDSWSALGSTKAVGAAGQAARGAYDRAVAGVAGKMGTDKWDALDSDEKFNRARGGMAQMIQSSMLRAGLPVNVGSNYDAEASVNKAIEMYGPEKVLSSLDKAGMKDAAAAVRASVEHKSALNAVSPGSGDKLKFVAAATTGSAQSALLSSGPSAASEKLLSDMRDSGRADKMMREAEGDLTSSGMSGEDAAEVRSNTMVRAVLHALKNNEIKEPETVLNSSPVEAVKMLRGKFPGITIEDVTAVRRIWSSIKGSKEKLGALGKYAVTRNAMDTVAVQRKVGNMAAGLADAAGSANPAISAAAKKLSSSMEQFAGANSREEAGAGLDGMTANAGALARAYHGALKGKTTEQQQALRGEMGTSAALLDRLGGAYGVESLSYDKAVQMAGGVANLAQMAPNLEAGQALFGVPLAQFQDKLAGNVFGDLARTGSGGTTTGSEIDALQAIAKNTKLQTDILILLAEKQGVDAANIRGKVADSKATPPNGQAGGTPLSPNWTP